MRGMWIGALALVALAVVNGVGRADVCQPCGAEEVEDPKMHGRSLKSYWGVAHQTKPPDMLVLAKAYDQGHLALCGTPDQWEWNMFMGMLAAEMEKFEQAGCYFMQALKHSEGKDHEKVLNNRGSFWVDHYNKSLDYFQKEAFGAALDEAGIAIMIAPDSCKAHNVKGSALSSLGRQQEAIPVLKAGLAVCPDHEGLKVNLFNAYFEQGNRKYKESSQADGDSARSQLLMEAISLYEQGGQILPNDPNIAYQLGSSYAQLVFAGDSTKAAPAREKLLAFLGTAQTKEDKVAALYQLTLVENETKDFSKAAEYCTQFIGMEPSDADGYRLMATIIRNSGDPTRTESYIILYNGLARGAKVKVDSLKALPAYSGSDLTKELAAQGRPDELRSYTDSSGNNMDAAFYWAKGKAIAFYGGQKRGEVSFQPRDK